MYFLTLPDPNYVVKGSRDPLGFQVLWQQAGREVIPYLSTVSGNVRDFQVMALADYCRQVFRIQDRNFVPFFLCMEQLMAYTRYWEFEGYDSFNGVDRVRRVMSGNEQQLSISAAVRDQLLSNQKSYGIWGKYNRPFYDMGLGEDPRFKRVQERKLEGNKSLRPVLEKLIGKKSEGLILKKDKPAEFGYVFAKPGAEERDCYMQYLLTDHSRGELLRLTKKYPELAHNGMSFYAQLDFLMAHTKDPAFVRQLSGLKHTERVLSPLNRIFRYLQGKSFWSFADIDADQTITEWSKSASPEEGALILPELSSLLHLNNRELVIGLALRNSQVCGRRGSEPWLSIVADGLEVNHFEGAFADEDYDPRTDNDNGYFLDTWFHLYRQLN